MVDVLVLYGSPGAGKSTLARALSETLGAADVAHGVVDLDDLSIVHPNPGRQFPRDNLRAVWPNYLAAAPGLKLIIPTVLADEGEVELLREAVPGARLLICELTAPVDVLKARVTEREPTDEWRSRLRDFVDLYHSRDDHDRIRRFRVSTHPATVETSVRDILDKAGWGAFPVVAIA
ncbi:AAA family ATPase [Actinoplanes sp. LDG1-06]|uniref:AAA family ATPase n=1 Tax=Paractinoplanes ovalisporus TaxID=2810368 RepID=A0ABS2A9X3_9ACTN|nr:AAA family ATPase [Actinoplanes ovalisporus]MBM2616623.1 AAA family ATPase [Actinoplanes ovalisporus]